MFNLKDSLKEIDYGADSLSLTFMLEREVVYGVKETILVSFAQSFFKKNVKCYM